MKESSGRNKGEGGEGRREKATNTSIFLFIHSHTQYVL